MINTLAGLFGVNNKKEKLFATGEKVKIIDGAFNGFEGIIEETSGDKIVVLVKIAGKPLSVEMKKKQIEKIVVL